MDEDQGRQQSGGALGALIELEQRIEAELDSAREQGRSLVDAARAEISEGASREDEALARALAELRERIERECEAALEALHEEAERTLGRYRGTGEAGIERLAKWVAARVAEGRAAP